MSRHHKSEKPPEHAEAARSLAVAGGLTLTTCALRDGDGGGAWIVLPGHDRCLSVQSFGRDNHVLTYAGYRDGVAEVDSLAISVDPDGAVAIQVVIPGITPEHERICTLSLDELHAAVCAFRGVAPPPQ